MEFTKKNWNVVLISDKREVEFDWIKIILDWMALDFPGEYEKSGILAQIAEIWDKLFFQLRVDDKNISYIPYDDIELTEEVLKIFWNIDVLVIKWSKNSIKIYENLEARYVLPYWEAKDIFFTTLGQHPEEVKTYKIKETWMENEVIFINIG